MGVREDGGHANTTNPMALIDIEDVVPADAPPDSLRTASNACAGTCGAVQPVAPRKVGPIDLQREQVAKLERVPGVASVWVRTYGCSHNISDSEYMLGQLQQYGYRITDDSMDADVWVVNTCTVKNPSQTAMANLLERGRKLGKPLLVCGCVPQGDHKAKELEGLSVLGVSQIDRVAEAVEQTLQGNTVHLLAKKELPRLDLPKIRRNAHVEIIPLSTGCLGSCTYCKTKHARGELGSYDLEALVDRARCAARDPDVREIWLSSEDTGAYGRDLGIKLPDLLWRMVEVLPKDGSTRLRIGMTNPPFILDSLDEMAKILRHPLVFSYLHIPVQSGSDSVLLNMNREYTSAEFKLVADTLLKLVPGMELATDIICGFPKETESDFEETLDLVRSYRFKHCHISQFYPRPGTPAARMKKVPTQTVKNRSRAVTKLVDSFTDCYDELVGSVELISIVDWATDKMHLVGHSKTYAQVLVEGDPNLMGCMAYCRITRATRWCVFGEILDTALPMDITQGLGWEYSMQKARHAWIPKLRWTADSLVGWFKCIEGGLQNVESKLADYNVDALLWAGMGFGVAGVVISLLKVRRS